jgi:hypothetical protein
MFRETLASNSRFADLVIAPDNQTSLQYRFSPSASAAGQNLAGSPAPYWVKLVKVGNVYTGYRSPDGVNWTQVGTPTTVTMGSSNIYVGLALTSHNNAQLNTAVFDNASVTNAGGLQAVAARAPAASETSGSTSTLTSSVWSGIDFGAPKTVTTMKFIPAAGQAQHMVGGRFVASNHADFSQPTTLFVIKTAPAATTWTTQNLTLASPFRYVRYVAADGTLTDVRDASFVGF